MANWLDRPIIEGDRTTLRPFVADDATVIAALLADPELLRLTASVTSTAEAEKFPSEPDEQMITWYATRATQDDRMDLAVLDNVSGQVVGEVVFNEFDPAANSCNFRTLIGESGRNRGIGTEATRLFLAYGFEQLGLHRISLDVFAFNPRAQRVYEKVGFRVEGVRRDALRFDDEYVEEIMMAILAPDPAWVSLEHHTSRRTRSVSISRQCIVFVNDYISLQAAYSSPWPKAKYP